MWIWLLTAAWLAALPAGALSEKPSAKLCKFTELVLAPDLHRDCQQAVLKSIRDPQDRAEMTRFLATWQPPANLEVRTQGPYLYLREGTTKLLEAAWLRRHHPAALWYNGEILIDERDYASAGRQIDSLLKKRRRAQATNLWSFSTEAHADPAPAKERARNLLVLFTTQRWNVEGSATEAISADNQQLLVNYFPPSLFKSPPRCEGNGLAAIELPLTTRDGRTVNLLVHTKSADDFTIDGLLPQKTVAAHLGPAHSGQPCLDNHTRVLLKTCADVASELATEHPAWPALNASTDAGLCEVLAPVDKAVCQEQVPAKLANLKILGNASPVGLSVCPDPRCTPPPPPDARFSPAAALDPALATLDQAAAEKNPLARPPSAGSSDVINDFLGRQLLGLSILSQCCHDAACPALLKDRYRMDLHNDTKPAVSR